MNKPKNEKWKINDKKSGNERTLILIPRETVGLVAAGWGEAVASVQGGTVIGRMPTIDNWGYGRGKGGGKIRVEGDGGSGCTHGIGEGRQRLAMCVLA